MSDRSVTDLPVRGLELLFAPPGLPLVDKGANQPTTSVLLYGDAGAGKTTLAIALAHAIARSGGGTALYLTTELAPTELSHKRELLGLAEVPVVGWEDAAIAPPGALVAGHLALIDPSGTHSVRERALQAIWNFVAEAPEKTAGVRCVVIDAFPLFEVGESTRDAIVSLLQALESRGISVVLIQEADGNSDYLPFVADIVFELRFVEDRDTGELVRKLGCRKSRYVRSLVGPHDTGLDLGAVAVWPDPLAVAMHYRPALRRLKKPARTFLPLEVENQFVVFQRGGIVLSTVDAPDGTLQSILSTPGVAALSVVIGPITRVTDAKRTILVPEWEGAYSVGWAINTLAEQTAANVVIVGGLGGRRHTRFHASFERVLEALRLRGMLICVHDTHENLRQLEALADCSAKQFRNGHGFPKLYRRSPAALLALASRPASPSFHPANDIVDQAVEKVLKLSEEGEPFAEMEDVLDAASHPTGTLGGAELARLALAYHALGLESKAIALVAVASKDLAAWPFAAIASFILGDVWTAARGVIQAPNLEAHAGLREIVWAGLASIYARNDEALGELIPAVEHVPWLFDMAAYALAIRSRWNEVDAVVETVGGQRQASAYVRAWYTATTRLASNESVNEARTRLMELSTHEDQPPLHRAFVFHNLGVAWMRTGDMERAREAWRRALEIHPRLEIAIRALQTPKGYSGLVERGLASSPNVGVERQ
jgi:KaiC/GvpD/RAD55 family RecA-like ATPase